MISIQELASYFYRAHSRYCGGTSQIDQDLFMEKLMDYLNQHSTLVLELRPSGKNYYDYDFSGDSRMGPFDSYDTPSSAISDALKQGKNIILIFYDAENYLDKICRVIDRADSYLYVQTVHDYKDSSHRYTSSPSLAIYSFYYNKALRKIANPVSTGWIFDISDIFNTPIDSTDWGTSEMSSRISAELSAAISSNSFFSVQQDKEWLPVRVFRKTIAGEFADETQYDLYKFLSFSKWEHLQITTHHSSSGSTAYTFVVSKETKEAGPYDLSWLLSYNPGDALPDEKVEELIGALDNHRPIFIRLKIDSNSFFRDDYLEGHQIVEGEKITLYFSSFLEFNIQNIVIDNYTKGDSTWSFVKAEQADILSESSLKTVNGQSLVGGGDITIETKSELEPFYLKVTNSSTRLMDHTAKEVYEAHQAGRPIIVNWDSVAVQNSPAYPIHISSNRNGDKFYSVRMVLWTYAAYTDTEKNSLIVFLINAQEPTSYKYSSIKTFANFTWSDIASIANKQEKLISGTNIKTINGNSVLGSGDLVLEQAVINPLPVDNEGTPFLMTSQEFFAKLKELYDAGTLKLNNIYYGNTEITDIVDGLLVQEMRVEVLPGDGGQVVFSAVATTSTYDDSLRPFRWETQSLNGVFSKWVGRATQDSIPTKISELANDAGYAKADTLETITDASEITVTCESGRIRQGNNIMTLAVGCSASDDSLAVEERIIFSTGSSVESVTVTGVSWANGDTPSFKANKVYEINISYIPLLGKFLATYAEY